MEGNLSRHTVRLEGDQKSLLTVSSEISCPLARNASAGMDGLEGDQKSLLTVSSEISCPPVRSASAGTGGLEGDQKSLLTVSSENPGPLARSASVGMDGLEGDQKSLLTVSSEISCPLARSASAGMDGLEGDQKSLLTVSSEISCPSARNDRAERPARARDPDIVNAGINYRSCFPAFQRTSMLIHVKSSTFHRTGTGTISGVIYLALNDFNFPDANWSDLPIALLAQWVPAFRKLARGITAVVDCSFMDGPFSFHLDRRGEQVLVRCFRKAKNLDQVGQDVSTSMQMIQSTLADAARVAVATCRQRGWASSDLNDLAAELGQLLSPVA